MYTGKANSVIEGKIISTRRKNVIARNHNTTPIGNSGFQGWNDESILHEGEVEREGAEDKQSLR